MQIEEIKKVNLSELLDPNILSRIEEFSEEGMFETEPKQAQEFFYALDELINNNKDELIRQPDIYQRYFKVLMSWFWQGFQSIEDSYKESCLSKYLIFSLRKGLDPARGIRRYLSLFEDDLVPDVELRNNLILSLTKNEEKIGNEMIELKTREKVVSTTKNWIRDYVSNLSDNSMLTGSFDKVNYLTNSINVRKLSPENKELLSKVIDIYRFLKNPKVSLNSGSEINRNATLVSRPIDQIIAPNSPVSRPPSTPKPTTSPVADPEIVSERSKFEKRLAEISAQQAQHGADLEILKRRVEESDTKRTAAPRANLNNPLNAELKREVATREIVAPKPDMNNPVNSEIRREVATPELPPYVAPKPVAPRPVPPAPKAAPAPKPTPPPIMPPRPAPRATSPDLSGNYRPVPRPVAGVTHAGSDLKDIQTTEDLKKINLSHLRQGPLQAQIQEIKSKILAIAQANRILPYYAVVAFEQSPLFQTYVASGNSKMESGELAGGMTHQEFEAVADLKKQVER